MSTKDLMVVNGYQITADMENAEVIVPIITALEKFGEIEERYKSAKYEYEQAKYLIERAFSNAYDSIGLKSIKNRYYSATFVQGTEGETKTVKKISELKVKALADELGIDENEYMIEEVVTSNKRKASVRFKSE